ncbi:transposase [Myxococcus sp. AM009]|uniref:transposase n=1 Tax=Myxococcus sp. AM009 TaxID=2745137 RepID=UPI001596223C|nr:transposase [Myxococcus sp. AM009]NVJ02793.1 transposase [Myxococcus sp. AM009]
MMATKTTEAVHVADGATQGGRRRYYSAGKKLLILSEAEVPGKSVSLVAHEYGVNPSQLFR